jgi:hypothetical protein
MLTLATLEHDDQYQRHDQARQRLAIWLRHEPVFTNIGVREVVTRVILFAG